MVVLALLAIVALVVTAALRELGPWLIVNEPLAKSDVVFVADGQTPQRELEGAALYHEGWAPRVALTLPREVVPDDVRRLAGEPTTQERAAEVLRRRGVPENAIVRLGRRVENTREELAADFEFARGRGFRRVIVVSSPYHTRRIRMMWGARYQAEIPVIVRATRYERVDPDRWWRARQSLEPIAHEVVGIANYLLGSPIPSFDHGR
jgi:uncharacterized SAM-binding protein YcdF (DUF218 family)